MKPGDMLRSSLVPSHDEIFVERCVYLGEELPWNDTFGLVGKSHPFPRGSIGIYLGRRSVTTNSLHDREFGPRIFFKILTPDGKVGWLHESQVEPIHEAR